MRHLRPLTTLLALSALAALALAPAHAMAVANNPSAGECRAPGAGDTVVLIGGQLCAANQGSGGNAGTGTGALPGGRQPGEVVWVTGEIPVCFRNPARCLPGQIGGRGGGLRFSGDDGRPDPGDSRKREVGASTRDEAPKGKGSPGPKPMTAEWCSMLASGKLVLSRDTRLQRVEARIKELHASSKKLTVQLHNELEKQAATIEGKLKNLREQPFADTDEVLAVEVALLSKSWEIWDLEDEIQSRRNEASELIDVRIRLEEEVEEVRGAMLERCAELFGPEGPSE
jgi:hypothetical protein